MEISSYTTKTVDQLLTEFQLTKAGLSTEAVDKQRQRFGFNSILAQETHWWDILLRQFKSPFIYLLIAASFLSLFFQGVVEMMMILVFVLLNAVLGFYQEYRSERTLKLLKQYLVLTAKVTRDGQEMVVKSAEIVPGDLLVLEAGDVVAADCRLIEESDFSVDESALTGESASVKKTNQPLTKPAHEFYQSANICFSGTTVVTGEGKAIVLKTGGASALGKIAKLTTETQRLSNFEIEIGRLSKFILRLILITLVLVFLMNIFIKGAGVNIPTLIIFSIALAVSVIPEALPIVITFSLSRGALHLAKNKVVVKRLSAIEDLGSIEVLCVDKTGTLTENQLTVADVYRYHNEDALLYGFFVSSFVLSKVSSINSFDLAIKAALQPEEKKLIAGFEKIAVNPFDPARKRSSVLVKKNNQHQLIVRGTAEEIIKLSSNIVENDRRSMTDWVKKEGQAGRRVIGVAKKSLAASVSNNLVTEEKNLSLVGFISFVDPIKKTATAAVEKAKSLGIKIKILTGDSREVAGAVAHQTNLIKDPKQVITGAEFDRLSSPRQHEVVEEYTVFARVSPEQKYQIIKLLEEKHETGFVGEGINDAPALKVTNVAIAVAGATDVAREAADIILLKKSLRVIVDGINEGRVIFANTTKYIKATLASNFGNFYTVAITSLLINFLPLLPLQILLINLLTDSPMIAVATDNTDPQELMRPRNYDVKEIALVATIFGVVSSVFDFIFFGLFYQISPAVLQTNWFICSVITELVFLFSIRSKLSIFKASRPSTSVLCLSGLALVTALVIPFTAFGHYLFKFISPSTGHLSLIFFITGGYFIVTETLKVFYYKVGLKQTE